MHVGYKLVRMSDNVVINSWGGTFGQCPGIPNPLVLPNGDHVCGAEPGEYGEWRLELLMAGPSATDVKSECQRRIIALTGTSDIMSCIIKQSNANMRANEINDRRLNGDTLTESEAGEAAALRNLAVAIKALRSKSNDIEAMDPIPLDYSADIHWL